MGSWGELPSRDARAARCLRAVLGGWDEPADRHELALYSTAVVRNYLMERWARRRFGFQDPFDRVADDVAGMETALLLDPDRRVSLRKVLRRRLAGTDPLEARDRSLALAFRKHLRMRGRQGLEREWSEKHRGEALLLRCLRVTLPRIDGIRLISDARGRLIVGPASDMTRPPIGREELAVALRTCAPDFRPQRIGLALRERLFPDGVHGGYCFMMDLVQSIHSMRAALLTGDPDGTGAAPASSGEAERKRAERLRTRLGAYLIEEGTRIDRLDLEKDRRKKDPQHAAVPAEARAARVAVAVEILLQEVGLADPYGEARSLTERLRLHLPENSRNGDLRLHVYRTDYLIERLRKRLRRPGPILLQILWRRWWEAA